MTLRTSFRSSAVFAATLLALAAPILAQTTATPDAPQPQQTARPLQSRPEQTPAQAAEALRISRLPLVNGVPYDQPSVHDLLIYYAHDTYIFPAQVYDVIRTTYSFARDRPSQWGQDFPGYGQRLGAAELTTAINGNVRLGMELALHEDLRYLPCHHCSFRKKLRNALLSEVTARHGEDGRRFFSVTPAIADFSGPIVYHSSIAPEGFNPMAGVISTRVVAVTRIGVHLAEEYWVDRHHKREPR